MNNKYFYFISGKITILLLIILVFFACDTKKSKIPVVTVDQTIDMVDALFHDLQQIGGYVYVTGGVNGIIVYRSNSDEFKAFERTCPHDPECGRVSVDESALSVIDTEEGCCGSIYSLLLEGAVTQGPSKFPLKQYKCVYYESSQIIRITN